MEFDDHRTNQAGNMHVRSSAASSEQSSTISSQRQEPHVASTGTRATVSTRATWSDSTPDASPVRASSVS